MGWHCFDMSRELNEYLKRIRYLERERHFRSFAVTQEYNEVNIHVLQIGPGRRECEDHTQLKKWKISTLKNLNDWMEVTCSSGFCRVCGRNVFRFFKKHGEVNFL